jgi:glycosyltransferase involved in cell wall biosynthesis
MSRGLRVLLVTDAVGGVWVYTVELARSLRAFGVEPLLAVMGPSPSEEQRDAASGLRLIDTGLPLDWMPTSPSELRRAGDSIAELATREGVDVVQSCSAALLADSDFDQPCVAVQHSCVASWWSALRSTPLPSEFQWRRELVECGLNRARAIVAPTASFAAETARIYDVSRPVLSVHNGRRAPAASDVPQSDFVFTVGRLWDDGKNVATLDAAAARLAVPFHAAGPTRGPNGAQASFEHLKLLGELSETRLAGVLAARPIFASAALYEPFGLSALEAAQAGCALVLSDIPTFRELWRGVAEFVAPRDDAAFASAIQRLLDNPDQRSELGRAARIRAQRYTPVAMAERMADIYSRVAVPAISPGLAAQRIELQNAGLA